tara:strand:- start:71 stop:487 length:417 start_codon:yes stop_codon:yes gene_type:complete
MVGRAPRKRMYRTMQGRMVDIEKLRAANESVQAVGNMNVNARGDVLGPGGQVATPKQKIIQKYYEQPKGMVNDTPIRYRSEPAPQKAKEKAKPIKKMSPISETPKKTETVKSEPVNTFKPKTESTPKKGIDAALDGLE